MSSATTMGQLPQHQTAIVAQGPGQMTIQKDAPVPALAHDMVLVKTATVAINPVDVKSLDYSPAPGAIIGFDFAGTIVALGSDAVKEGRLAVGDRVAGVVYGMDRLQPDVGAFAQYVGALADLVLKLPDHISLEDAAALGLATATAAYGLFKEMELPGALDRLSGKVSDRSDFVLVAGGSTATGTRAIELLKTAGFRPVATSSPSNFELVKKFGAEAVFDYHDPGCADAIKAYTNNELDYALDCIAEAETTQLCYAAIGRAGGRYVAVEPFRESIAQSRINTVKASWFNVMTVWGRKVELGGEYAREASLEDREFGARSFAAVQTLLDRGFVTTHPIKLMSGGWEGVVEGVDKIRSQPPSGYKLVCQVA
ncbi:enoyl reductase [Trichoderma guizhouense]|uniref:Enoyl reductase n=1 Tax=Trichoderma guizhouense TaxID=1491466 RepID=A0A1T3CQU7_9HYPO|nr:enoyl reductase [Trichoderma guizhouense]